MYDGSEPDDVMNVINTSLAVEFAARTGASVEGEIGSMGAREGGGAGSQSVYTEPGDALEFVRNTKVDTLACAFGTAHGLYTTAPKLDFDRVKRIYDLIPVPIVMHGGSGVSDEDYKKVISLGVRKINYYTYMAKAGGTGIANMENATFFHDVEKTAYEAMKKDVKRAISLFAGI